MALAEKYFWLAKEHRKAWIKYVRKSGRQFIKVKNQVGDVDGKFTYWVKWCFGQRSIRTVQYYMQVARCWSEVKKLIERDPQIALRQIVKKLRKKKRKTESADAKSRHILNKAIRVFVKVWPHWTSEQIESLEAEFTLPLSDIAEDFKNGVGVLMNKLRLRVGRHHGEVVLQNDIRSRFTPLLPAELFSRRRPADRSRN